MVVDSCFPFSPPSTSKLYHARCSIIPYLNSKRLWTTLRSWNHNPRSEHLVYILNKLTIERSYNPLMVEALNHMLNLAGDTHPPTKTHSHCSSINVHKSSQIAIPMLVATYVPPPASTTRVCRKKPVHYQSWRPVQTTPDHSWPKPTTSSHHHSNKQKRPPQKVWCKQAFQQSCNWKHQPPNWNGGTTYDVWQPVHTPHA